MGRAGEYAGRFGSYLSSIPGNAREKSREVAGHILRPKKFEKFTEGPEDRLMQVLALFVVGPVIVVSLVAIEAINDVMTELFGGGAYGDQSGLFAWFVTGLTGGLFLLAAWTWFQFVRTYGFGFFRWT